jgi:hypothetical protein
MNDSNAAVRKAAFLAAGNSGNKLLLQELINKINTDEKEIIQPLFIAGAPALPFINSYITGEMTTRLQKEKLILLCGRIGGEQAKNILLSLIATHPEEYMVVIKSLYRSNYTPRPTEINDFIAIAKSLLSRCAGIIYMQNSLEPQGEKYNLLINSFKLELIGMRDCLLYVFAMMYDRENINKVRIAYATEKKESIINAMEIIDIAVRKDIGSNFNIIFEPGNISERMHSLRKVYPIEFFENVERVLINILAENAKPYSNWTMACSLYTSKKQQHGIDNSLIVKYTTAENRLLRETALFAL